VFWGFQVVAKVPVRDVPVHRHSDGLFLLLLIGSIICCGLLLRIYVLRIALKIITRLSLIKRGTGTYLHIEYAGLSDFHCIQIFENFSKYVPIICFRLLSDHSAAHRARL
jgi:hypothetical protein